MYKMKTDTDLQEQEAHQLTIVEEDRKKSAENETHKGPALNSDSTECPVANYAISIGNDKSRKQLPIKKREDRTSQHGDSKVSVKEENTSTEPVPAQENDSDTDTEWSEPLRKALLDLQQSNIKQEADDDQDATGQKTDTKKRDQYPPKKRRKYVDYETGDVLYSKVAPITGDEKTSKDNAALPVVMKTSARRKSSRPLKLVSHRTSRTSQAAAKSANSIVKNTSKKPSKSVTTCTQTTETPNEGTLPSEDSLLLEQKVKVENGLEPPPRKRRGRKPGK